MYCHRRWFRLAISLILLAELVSAQEPPSMSQTRPRVGLALSGGGALGLAHVGVLLYFEEHHIPIDAMAGTSMGALVGGLYAAGLDAKELNDVANHADWDLLLNPTPQYRDQPIVEKQSWNRTYGNFTLHLGRRFSLPQGINSGEALGMFLSRYTAAYGQMETFDDLPTPFRCVATDLIKANPVTLQRGSLAKAMRASMSIPAIFTPVRWDDMLLVDGAFVENLPVETAQSMGVQRVIAVALQGKAPRVKDLTSLPSIALRAVSVATEQNERRSAAKADLVIVVDASEFVATDYPRAKDLIRIGYDAAQKRAEDLRQFEVSEDEWIEYQARRSGRRLKIPPVGAVVAATSQREAFSRNAADELRRKLGSSPVSLPVLEDTLSGMVAATGVPGSAYRLDTGKHGYVVDFLERPGDSLLIRPSFTFSTSAGEPSQAALRLSVSHIAEKAYKERTLATVTLGYDPGLRAEHYRPFGGTGFFIAPGMLVEHKHFNSYVGSTRTAFTRDRFAGTMYVGMGTWRFVQIRVGATAGYDSYDHETKVDGVIARSRGFATPELTWIYNTQDSGGLPYRGTKIEGASGYSFRDTSHPYFINELTNFTPITQRVSLLLTSQASSTFGQKVNFYEQFTGGGAGQLAAFRYQEFHANTLVTGGGGLIFHAPPVRRLSVYPGIALLYEAGRFDQGSLGWATHQSSTTGIFFPTPIGAAGVSVSFNENGKARFRLSLGALSKR